MVKINFDRTVIREFSYEHNIPITSLILNTFKKIAARTGINRTLFAACPNSEAVLKAGLIAAKRANAPIKFAATLNQVDIDGGYTGWTHETFVKKVKGLAEEVGCQSPIIIAVDHGGPWLRDFHNEGKWELEETMEAIKTSFTTAIFAGYDLIHVDPTVDKTLRNETISIDTVIKRTLELINYTERVIRRNGLHKIDYEVGTEEVHGGLADINTFRRFLDGLHEGLAKLDLDDVWPVFVVGKVGTDLHTTLFDAEMAKKLVEETSKHGCFVKGHYSDYVTNPEEYPLSGMGGANVGPEFTEIEYEELMNLIKIENELFNKNKINNLSNLKAVLTEAVIASGRWKKWLNNDENGLPFKGLKEERKEWLIKTGCRYIWTHASVMEARRVLMCNLKENGILGEVMVTNRIVDSMMKYYNAFNLINSNNCIREELGI